MPKIVATYSGSKRLGSFTFFYDIIKLSLFQVSKFLNIGQVMALRPNS